MRCPVRNPGSVDGVVNPAPLQCVIAKEDNARQEKRRKAA